MGFLQQSNASPTYTGLQLSTATSTLPIPIVWGTGPVASNVLWYMNFRVVQGTSPLEPQANKGWLKNNQGVYYTADVILGLCEGPIGGVNAIWRAQTLYNITTLNLSLLLGTSPQAPYAPLYSGEENPNFPNENLSTMALGYQGIAYACAANYVLDQSAGIENHKFEIQGIFCNSGMNGLDANPALVIYDFLTNKQYGCGFDPNSIDAPSLFGSAWEAVTEALADSTGAAAQAYAAARANPALYQTMYPGAYSTAYNYAISQGFPSPQAVSIANDAVANAAADGAVGGDIAAALEALAPSEQDNSVQAYCAAMGISFSPCLTSTEQASSVLTRWLQIINTATFWSQGKLHFRPYGDTTVFGGAVQTSTVEQQVAIDGQAIQVASGAQFVSDGGVVYANGGGPLTYVNLGAGVYPTTQGQYNITGPIYLFSTYDMGIALRITFTYKIGIDAYEQVWNYTPNLVPSYNIADDGFVEENEKSPKDPITVSRVDPFSLATIQRLECLNRQNEYSLTPVEARDQSQIDLYGPRVGSTIQAHEICDALIVGPIVVQTIMQRNLYVRQKFSFKLSWEYCLLDPMDIVTINDANLGLSNYLVRITSIEEDEKNVLTIEAEELPDGVHYPANNPTAGQYGTRLNRAAIAPASTPLIYEPPTSLTAGIPEIWFGAYAPPSATPDPTWGGANVWMSSDNVTFAQVARINHPLRQGTLTAPLSNATTGWDTTDTLSVTLSPNGGTLSGTTQSAAQRGATLTLVESELICYEVATLTGALAYDLTTLLRGAFGTTPASHSTGVAFTRLDFAVEKYTLPAHLIGVALYFKFQSFNAFGQGVQNLAECTAYPFLSTGSGAVHPIAARMMTGQALDLGQVTVSVGAADDFGHFAANPNGAYHVVDVIDLGSVPSQSHANNPIAAQLLAGNPVSLGWISSAETLADDFGQVENAVVQTVNLGTAP